MSSPQEYPFPDKAKLEEANYCTFPLALEDDPLVVFHVTPETKMADILRDGFKSATELGEGLLESVSFSYRSREALTHSRNRTGAQVILAVRYQSLDLPWVVRNATDIHDYRRQPAPMVIGFCRLPVE